MSLASMIAKQVVKAGGDIFQDTDIQKAISAQVDEVVSKNNLDSKEGQDYLLRMTKAMVTDDPNFKVNRNLDPNLGMYLEVENKLFSGNPDMRDAYHAAKINNAKLGGSSGGGESTYIPAYKSKIGRTMGKKELFSDLEKIGIEYDYDLSTFDIQDFESMSASGKRLIKALEKEDFFGYDNLDQLLSDIFESGIENYEPSSSLRQAFGRYLNEISMSDLAERSDRRDFKYAEGGAVTRTIKRGDTLSKISKETGVSISDLVKLNNIENPDLIRAGDTLILGTESKPEAQPTRREVKRPVQREEPKRTGIRAVAARRTRATPTENRSLLSRLGQSFSDAKNALITEAIPINIRAFVGDLVGDDSKITERDLSAKEREALKRIALQTQAQDKSVIEYADYQTDANNKTQYVDVSPSSSNIDVVGKTATSPEYALKTTLGQAKITTDNEGNTIIIDRYNFNDARDDFQFDEFMDSVVSAGFSGYAQARNLARYFGSGQGEGAEVEINLGKLNPKEVGTVAMLTQERTQSAKGGKVDKKKMACNKPKRTPNHPKKSHVVKACKDGKEKIIRFGEQGAKTAGKPKAGESKRMKAKRKSFKARHRKNIKRGNMSAAYWADKVKW